MEKIYLDRSSALSSKKGIDWHAYEFLQRQILKANPNDVFKIECLDIALNAVLQAPKRKAKGQQLGMDLFSDAKKMIINRNNPSKKHSIAERSYYDVFVHCHDQPTEILEISVLSALIISALNTLSAREKNALLLMMEDRMSETDIQNELFVGTRQFKNILNGAIVKINATSFIKNSGAVIRYGAKQNQEYIIELIVAYLKK